jgi:hypothetical protein
LAKDQVAPVIDSYTGIGFRATIVGGAVRLLTLEKHQPSDLYLRRVNAQTGVISAPRRLKLDDDRRPAAGLH